MNDETIEITLKKFLDAHNSRDWDLARSILSDEVVFVDHRPAGFGTLDKEGFIDSLLAAISLVSDRTMTVAEWFPLARTELDPESEEVVVARLRGEGTDEYGSTVEWGFISVWTRRDGSVTRMEIFDNENVEEAIERAVQLLKDC